MKYDQGVRNTEIVTLEIPEEELDKMVKLDYERRLSEACSHEIVEMRTPIEIIEEWNRKEYNSWQTHNRRKVALQKEADEGVENDMMDMIADKSQIEARQRQEDYDEICQKIHQVLKPEQAEMIIAICLDGMIIKDYALEIGEKPDNIYKKLNRAKTKLKLILQKRPI